MKREIIISLIIWAAATAATLLLTRQCESPDTRIVIREHVRTDTLRLAPDTVILPGTVNVAPPPVSVNDRTLRDSLALLRERLDSTLASLAELATVTARGDTILERTALLNRGGVFHTMPFLDTLAVRYEFPPKNSFRITHGSAAFTLPPDTVVSVEYESRPWWVDLAIGLAGAAAAWLSSQTK